MNYYVVLLRGVNVGGKNKLSMLELKIFLENLGFTKVSTYIASGNVILQSDKNSSEIKKVIEKALVKNFKLDSEFIKVLVLSHDQLEDIISNKPKGFGNDPKKYYSDVIFLIDLDPEQALLVFRPREEVDKIWSGKNVIYSQRLGSLRTKSRLSYIVGTPEYKSMTIRTWNTVTELLSRIDK